MWVKFIGWRDSAANTCQTVHRKWRISVDGGNSEGSARCCCESEEYCWSETLDWVRRNGCQHEKSCKLWFHRWCLNHATFTHYNSWRTEWASWSMLQEDAISPCLNIWWNEELIFPWMKSKCDVKDLKTRTWLLPCCNVVRSGSIKPYRWLVDGIFHWLLFEPSMNMWLVSTGQLCLKRSTLHREQGAYNRYTLTIPRLVFTAHQTKGNLECAK